MNKSRYVLDLIWPPFAVLAGFLAIVELAVRAGWIASFLVPPPSAAAMSLVHNFAEIAEAFKDTALASFAGFGLSVAIGVTLAIALSTGGWVRRAFYPYAVFFQTVPIIAIAPLLVIWFGFGPGAVIASAFVASVFPVIANTLAGLLSVDAPLVDLFRLYRAKPIAALIKLRLPFALPHIFTGLRVAAGLSVIGAIVGEFITGSGLGGLIQVSRQQRAIDKVFATLFASSLLGVLLFAIINLLARVSLRHWHASERNEQR